MCECAYVFVCVSIDLHVCGVCVGGWVCGVWVVCICVVCVYMCVSVCVDVWVCGVWVVCVCVVCVYMHVSVCVQVCVCGHVCACVGGCIGHALVIPAQRRRLKKLFFSRQGKELTGENSFKTCGEDCTFASKNERLARVPLNSSSSLTQVQTSKATHSPHPLFTPFDKHCTKWQKAHTSLSLRPKLVSGRGEKSCQQKSTQSLNRKLNLQVARSVLKRFTPEAIGNFPKYALKGRFVFW